MKKYKLIFKLTKHKEARTFSTTVTARDTDDIQGVKEERSMYFEKLWKTPVKCVKVEEIK